MDNELKIFLQSFKELENLFQALPITDTQFQQLKDTLSGILQNAKNLALYDSITHALNARAGKWLIPMDQIKGMAKVDIYDLRQANKVYGVSVVDAELHKLAYQFMSIFTLDKGDFVRRAPGSDEFRIFSTSKTPPQIKRLLSKLYARQETDSLLTWDFGVGLTETESENELQKQRKAFRPVVLRQTILESYSEIPRRMEEKDSRQSWNEFNTPYNALIDTIISLALPVKLEQQTIEQVKITQSIVESIVTRETLTGTLNGLASTWYIKNETTKSVALTDMLNMHEGNTRYGSAAIDQDLKRFSNMLMKYFPKDEGFLLFRSERAGDEFKIVSTRNDPIELDDRIQIVWGNDLHRGLLDWNYGVGRNDAEAHVNLYKNRLKEIESIEMSNSTGRSTFIIVRPEIEDYDRLFKIAEDAARVVNGTPIIDLHLTIQAIRNVEDFESLKKRLTEYSLTLNPFEISAKHIARMNVNNQQGRLWLLAEKSSSLKKIYTDISQIAREMGYDSYSYEAQDWLPHIKIVELSENTSTQIKDPTFGADNRICFSISHIEWTLQRETERWELLDKFPFHE
jgi:GGDEF domain-containing protein